jgi:transposase
LPLLNLPEVEGLCLEAVVAEAQQICITVATTVAHVPCSVCGVASSRVQSRYQRIVADLPQAGVPVRLLLHVCRFRCENPACPRVMFCERLGPAIAAYARRTQRLELLLQRVGLALGGEAGARLSQTLVIATSPDTLLRLVQHLGLRAVPTPRVLGVDEWAWRRGQRYGTILVDLERHCVVDLLPDRRTETFAAWLVQHPGVEVMSRDRAGTYAEGGRLGAPQAIQIANRWHLIQNLALALEPVVQRQFRSLKPSRPKQAQGQKPKLSPLELRLTRVQRRRREDLHERFHLVQGLYEQGQSLREIAEIVEIDPNTLRYFVQSQPWARLSSHQGRKAGASNLAPYLPSLHKRWKAGCQNALQLWRELRARGYPGSASSVKPYVALLRQVPTDLLPLALIRQERPETEAAWSVRRIVWLALARPEKQTREQTRELAQVCALSEQIATALTLAQTFVQMLREKHVEALPTWLESARSSPLRGVRRFAQGIERDRAAVEAALCRPESNGQTEGQVTR